MNSKYFTKQKLFIFVGTVSLLLLLFIARYFYIHRVSYQLEKLAYGTPREKVIAASYLADNKVYEAIPLLIENIDNDHERANWPREPKSGKLRVSCVVTMELTNLTEKSFGNACVHYFEEKTDLDIEIVKQKWLDWYHAEYTFE